MEPHKQDLLSRRIGRIYDVNCIDMEYFGETEKLNNPHNLNCQMIKLKGQSLKIEMVLDIEICNTGYIYDERSRDC